MPQSVFNLASKKSEPLYISLYTLLDYNANHTKEYYTLNCGYNLQKGETHITTRQLEDFLKIGNRKALNMLKALVENGDIKLIRKGSKKGNISLPSIYFLTRYDESAEEFKKKVEVKKQQQKKENIKVEKIDNVEDLF